MFWKIYRHAAVAVIMALAIVACESAEKDPYETVTLRQVTRGEAVSKGFKYKLVNPKVVAMYRHLGVIREGNLLEFISARSLEDKLQGLVDNGQNFDLAVVKEFSPFVHFRVEKIYTEVDTMFMTQTGSIAYPMVRQTSDYSTESYEKYDINKIPYNRTGVLRTLVDNKYEVTARITMEEEEGQQYFVLHGDNAMLKVDNPDDGTAVILKMLAENNYPFTGGIVMTSVEDYGVRMKTKVAGTVEVKWVKYGTTVVSG